MVFDGLRRRRRSGSERSQRVPGGRYTIGYGRAYRLPTHGRHRHAYAARRGLVRSVVSQNARVADFGAGVWEFTSALQSSDKERHHIYKAIGQRHGMRALLIPFRCERDVAFFFCRV